MGKYSTESICIDNFFLDAIEAWNHWVSEHKIRNPFEEKMKIFEERYVPIYNPDGSTSFIINDKTEEQIEQEEELKVYTKKFITEREIWKGQYILENYGYSALIKFAQTHLPEDTPFWEWFERIRPCDGPEGQCVIFCPYFNNSKENNC